MSTKHGVPLITVFVARDSEHQTSVLVCFKQCFFKSSLLLCFIQTEARFSETWEIEERRSLLQLVLCTFWGYIQDLWIPITFGSANRGINLSGSNLNENFAVHIQFSYLPELAVAV